MIVSAVKLGLREWRKGPSPYSFGSDAYILANMGNPPGTHDQTSADFGATPR
jgi:hypothetical protein